MAKAKHRGNSEGSIYQQRPGLWCAAITTGRDATGKLKRRYIYGHSRKEVADKLNNILNDKQKGLPVDVDRQTVGQFLTRWLEDSVRGSKAPKTYARYKSTVNTHLIPELGKIRLSKLSPQHLQALYRKLQDAGGHDKAFKCHAVLRAALNLAVKWGLIPRNPALLVDAPKVVRREMSVLTADQARRFLKAAEGDRFYALYVLAITTGMRLGELLGLEWKDIDFAAGTLQVRRQFQRVKNTDKEPSEWQERAPKRHSQRTVFLTPLALQALKEHRKRQAEERLKLADVWQDLDLVFPSEIGTHMEPGNVNRRSFRHILAKEELKDLPRIRPHDLRHTAATLLLAAGVHPKIVQEQLGHSQISVTLDTYSHVLPSMKQAAAQAMDAILSGAADRGYADAVQQRVQQRGR